MNKHPLKYHFPKLMLWIGLAELAFWGIFVLFHILIAVLKDEALVSSFLVYQHPVVFWFLLLLPVLYGLYLSNLSWKNSVLDKSFSARLQKLLLHIPSLQVSFWRFFILRTSFVFVILALANPQGGSRNVEIDGKGGEIVVAVDVSRSMLVRDMENGQSRMDAAKNGLNNMLRNLPGTSLGMVVFAGSAYAHLPITRDVASVSSYIDELSTDMIGVQGTDLAEAINVSLKAFSMGSSTKIIYLITDGEDHEGGVDEALSNAQQQGAVLHVIALGSIKGGPIPEKMGGVKRDKSGEIITSVPNFELLEKIAQTTGGTFWQETSGFPNFAQIVNESFLNQAPTEHMASKMRKSYGGLFALQALILLMVYLMLLDLNFKKDERA